MKLNFERAFAEELVIKDIISKLGWGYINSEQVRCVFSKKSQSRRVIARIWSTPRIFSFAYGTKPLYAIELLKNRYEKLDERDKIKVLIHELLHIPKTFSGALKPHFEMQKTLNCGTVENYYKDYMEK
ncbi:metallopeptidase [archaeon CG_4_10_14_0_2_um_filter_Archaea_38_6]|nr:MAG: metallopeptidase [archaeon CG07_land_8_20_14_0_80_38_8]PIU88741.1 MAG: metallopeptidase [archaeon CG06_land_8_20_14_3_00_37_11]PJA22766.1 MAG: metallopeptidase [archaeon CG_4_10_14_0_2_um_filter_Archaea_38_6]